MIKKSDNEKNQSLLLFLSLYFVVLNMDMAVEEKEKK